MIRIMKTVAVVTLAAFCAMTALYLTTDIELFLPLAITFGTVNYHFAIRLIFGTAIDKVMKNRADYNNYWFREKAFEKSLYEKLGVKKWKDKMPTAVPELFSMTNSYDDIAQAMCQAEVVHEINVVLSFLPLAASIWFGAFGVFFVTSLLGALYDMLFVIMQRHNRPRVVRIAERQKKKNT